MSFSKPKPENDQELETMLTETFGPPPRADIDAWRKRYPSALAWLDPQRIGVLSQRRKRMQRIILLATTTAAAICVWLGFSHFNTDGTGASAFAQVVDQIQKAKTITWKTTFYMHETSKDGKRSWLKTETKLNAYKTPGLYRETVFDQKGQIWSIEITDTLHRKKIALLPQEKKAILSELAASSENPRGPFDWVKKELEDPTLQWVEKRITAAGEANIFRHAFRDNRNGSDWSYDFWIDQKTKQLVELHVPGADIYDPDKDPDRNSPPGKKWSCTALSHSEHDIVWDADLDESQFSFELPEGYNVKTEHRGQVTEKEMIDYLGILADFNDKTFPDQPWIRSDRVNKAWRKTEKDRTAAEQKLVAIVDHYAAIFQRMPTGIFLEDHTLERSFRYIGKGVKLGDKDRIVCWYKLKDAKDPSAYRVIYGDLSVKDVAAKDLPLPVEP